MWEPEITTRDQLSTGFIKGTMEQEEYLVSDSDLKLIQQAQRGQAEMLESQIDLFSKLTSQLQHIGFESYNSNIISAMKIMAVDKELIASASMQLVKSFMSKQGEDKILDQIKNLIRILSGVKRRESVRIISIIGEQTKRIFNDVCHIQKAANSKMNTVFEQIPRDDAVRWRSLDEWALKIPKQVKNELEKIKQEVVVFGDQINLTRTLQQPIKWNDITARLDKSLVKLNQQVKEITSYLTKTQGRVSDEMSPIANAIQQGVSVHQTVVKKIIYDERYDKPPEIQDLQLDSNIQMRRKIERAMEYKEITLNQIAENLGISRDVYQSIVKSIHGAITRREYRWYISTPKKSWNMLSKIAQDLISTVKLKNEGGPYLSVKIVERLLEPKMVLKFYLRDVDQHQSIQEKIRDAVRFVRSLHYFPKEGRISTVDQTYDDGRRRKWRVQLRKLQEFKKNLTREEKKNQKLNSLRVTLLDLEMK